MSEISMSLEEFTLFDYMLIAVCFFSVVYIGITTVKATTSMLASALWAQITGGLLLVIILFILGIKFVESQEQRIRGKTL